MAVFLLGLSQSSKLLTVNPVSLGDGPYGALAVQCKNGPLIQAFAADGMSEVFVLS